MKNLFKMILIVLFLFLESYGQQQYRGIFIGINDYQGLARDLQDAVSDALGMRSMLVYNKNWNYSNCHVLLDGNATKDNIWSEILNVPKTSSTTTIFSYAGHGESRTMEGGEYDGMLIPNGEWFYYLTPVDLEDLFTYSYNNYAAFIDCCGSGVFPRDMNHGVISSACADYEESLEDYYGHGIYTYWIEMGLVGRYHDDAEGVHTYAAPLVINASGQEQHPALSDNYPGNLNIYNGLGKISDSVKEEDNTGQLDADEFSLDNNYPNPFNPTTKISFSIKEMGFVTLKVFDILGREITTLLNESKPAGRYEIDFNASHLPSGTYVYKLIKGNKQITRKMILSK